jgi:hypothetical protein
VPIFPYLWFDWAFLPLSGKILGFGELAYKIGKVARYLTNRI